MLALVFDDGIFHQCETTTGKKLPFECLLRDIFLDLVPFEDFSVTVIKYY